MATTTATPGRRRRKSIPLSAPKTPKDVRQLDRKEMIEYLQKYDDEIPNNVDELMRASLQKRVIQCMKQQQNSNPTPLTKINTSSQITQSAIPNSRISRKRYAEYPLTGSRNKRMRTNNNTNQCIQRRLPISTLLPETAEEEHKDEDIDINSLQLQFDLMDNSNGHKNIEYKINEENVMKDKLLKAVRNGIPARYDIVSLAHSILNLGEDNTSYLRSLKMQKLFELSYMGHELQCVVRTIDDVYQLNNYDIEQIESNICQWVHKYGEYSSNIHCSIHQNNDNKLEAKDYIFQYEVLGRFIGDEMIENEFYEVYSGTFDEYRRSLHSWVFEVNIPIIEKNNNDNINSDDTTKKYTKYEQYDMLVDCLGKTNKSHSKLLLIEDCRSDLSKLVTTKQDLRKENVLFVTIEINGWPGKFAIAKRNINKNEILYGHFGEGYSSLRKQVKRQQQSVDYFVSSIQKIIT